MTPRNRPGRADRRAQRAAEHRSKQQRERDTMLARIEQLADDDLLDERMLDREHEEHRQIGASVALAVLAVAQIAIVSALSWYPRIAGQLHLALHPGWWPYVVAVLCFLPLALRNRNPLLALGLTGAFTMLYLAMPWPPAIVILAPMSALFTVSERYGGRRAIPVGIVLGAIVLGVSALTVSVNYTVAQLVAIFALLGLAATLGHTAQQRRELFEEVRRKRKEQNLRRVEEERLRIARDVHDIMAHSLTLMTLQADAGLAGANDTEKAAAAFTVIGETGRATLRDLRSMLAVLAGDDNDGSPREPVADLSQLESLVASVRETGLDVSLETSSDLSEVPSTISTSAYRIVQESLTNTVRHAHASHARIEVHVGPSELTLCVSDDGAGGGAASTGSGRGLAGMAERVEVLGGTVTAGPRSSGGFEVRATIPLNRSTS